MTDFYNFENRFYSIAVSLKYVCIYTTIKIKDFTSYKGTVVNQAYGHHLMEGYLKLPLQSL